MFYYESKFILQCASNASVTQPIHISFAAVAEPIKNAFYRIVMSNSVYERAKEGSTRNLIYGSKVVKNQWMIP